jgi:hypothetical protein
MKETIAIHPRTVFFMKFKVMFSRNCSFAGNVFFFAQVQTVHSWYTFDRQKYVLSTIIEKNNINEGQLEKKKKAVVDEEEEEEEGKLKKKTKKNKKGNETTTHNTRRTTSKKQRTDG